MQKFIISEIFSNKLLKSFKIKINAIRYKQLYSFMENNSKLCRKIMDYVPDLYKLLCISKKFNTILEFDIFDAYLVNICSYMEALDNEILHNLHNLYYRIDIGKISLSKYYALKEKIFKNDFDYTHIHRSIVLIRINILSLYTNDDFRRYSLDESNIIYSYIYINNVIMFDKLCSTNYYPTILTDDIDIISISNKIEYLGIITIGKTNYRKYAMIEKI